MKAISKISLILVGAAALFSSCQKDPWKVVEEGSWNNDRMITEIKFEGQAGTAVIENIDETTGLITVQLATDNVPDMSAVTVETITLSYKATSTVQKGSTIDFTSENPTIVVTSQTGKSRTYTFDMSEFRETLLGCYSINGIHVFGGTGANYGGGAVLTPESKSWCWDARDGHGPEAEYDDYLEFTLDEITADGNTVGTCMHWGGADAKHWNCIFAASMNKEGESAIDLHKYYRQIPVGRSTWKRDYSNGTLSFTDANGNVTTCTIMETGEYELFNQDGYVKNITIPDQAFRFSTGGVDDWTNIYSDYDKFVKKVRSVFVHFIKVESIPAEAKTEGSEGDTSIAEPEPEPVVSGFDGVWKLNEMQVYGGTDPALIDPRTKSWVWYDIEKEMDNTLTLTTSESDPFAGTALYEAGADGEFWGYVFHNTAKGEIDCTKHYGWLYHGESTFKIDMEAGEVSFRHGAVTYTVKLLMPGSTTAYGSKELTIPADGFGLDFPCPGEPLASPTWDDWDRLAQCPRNYIMVFKKVTE